MSARKNTKAQDHNGHSATGSDPSAPDAAASKPAATRTVRAAKKASRKRPAKKTAAKKSRARKPAYEPSEADIRLRAYFIAERRVQLALQGDPALDWIQAREELLREGGGRRPS